MFILLFSITLLEMQLLERDLHGITSCYLEISEIYMHVILWRPYTSNWQWCFSAEIMALELHLPFTKKKLMSLCVSGIMRVTPCWCLVR